MIWTLTIPGRPESVNTFMKKVPMARAALKKPWRERAAKCADPLGVGLGFIGPVHVTFQPHLRGKRRQDVGACLLVAKACVDGLVDAGWLPDDSDEYVVGLTFRPAVYECDEDSLVMTIEEVSP